MDSKEVFQAIEKIAATSSKTGKELLVEGYLADDTFRNVVISAYDPFKTYGILPDKIEGKGTQSFTGTIWELIYSLEDRALTGSAAESAVAKIGAMLDPDSAELLRRILIKDLRAGFTERTVNRVSPGTIPTFDVMLAHKYEPERVKKWPVRVEPKLDGVRVLCVANGDSITFYSRTGKEFTSIDHMKDQVKEMVYLASLASHKTTKFKKVLDDRAVVLDGEMVSGNFNKTVGDVRRKNEAAEDAVYTVFDVLHLDNFSDIESSTIEVKFKERFEVLQFLLEHSQTPNIKGVGIHDASTHEEVMELYADFRAKGYEGAIVKNMDAFYYKKRNHAWMKIKNEETIDLAITGVYEGEGKYTNSLGGLNAEGEGLTAKVGGGFSDQQRADIWKVFKENPSELIGRVIEIEFHEKTPDGSLRHPRFIRFRDDKTVE